MNGIILTDKPAGITSFGVVARIRRLITLATGKKAKVGHAGTLDPFATGLLILLCGTATKKADSFLKLDKSYRASMLLGKSSTTADPEGEITVVSAYEPTLEEIKKVLGRYTGDIKQTPPIFSAIKVQGRRAYDLARKGLPVKLEPRNVTVYGFDNISYDYPTLNFDVHVSSGTYIRSLAVDIGGDLGTGAYLKELRRTSIGDYLLENAQVIDKLSPEIISNHIISIDNE